MLTEQEIIKLIQNDQGSERKKKAKKGREYYEGKHDIRNYVMYFINAQGEPELDTYRSNIKISHPFFTELVDQQVQYMLSGDNYLSADDSFLQEQLNKYFNDDFWAEINDLLTGTVSKGFDYLHAYTDKEGLTKFEYADGFGVIEASEKDTEDHEKYVIYWYTDVMDKGKKQIKRVQVWDKEYIYFYTLEDAAGIKKDDTAEQNPRKHTVYSESESGARYSKGFGFIPFFRLDNGRGQRSGLEPIKDIIDDYDLMSCSLSNNLQDFQDALYVVKGYGGDNLDELIHNVKIKKHIGVDSDGGIDVKTVDIPYDARKAKMEIDEKNIYRFGMGFNSAQIGDGNITNIVIKSRYALLDLKCNKLEIRLRKLLRRLLEIVIAEINKNHGKSYKVEDVKISFNREIMTNASDNADIALKEAQTKQIETDVVINISSLIPEEKAIRMICDILDIDFEQIKDELPKNEQQDNKRAQDIIEQVITDE